jgi:UDP-glucose 4-epimerase
VKVLVTGGAGFLGSWLCRLLSERGDIVVSFDLRATDSPDVSNEIGNILDLPTLVGVLRRDVDAIVHTVALADDNAHSLATYTINVFGMINLLEAMKLAGVRRAVIVSSQAAYQVVQSEPITEDHAVFSSEAGSPAGHYGASKAAADLIALTYFSYDGLDLRIVRLSSLYGPGMQSDMYIRSMVENAVGNKPTRFRSGADMRRDYTYILDAVDGVIRALKADPRDLAHRVFNVSSGRVVSTKELAETIRRIIDSADIVVGPGLTETERSDLKTRGVLDLSLARDELGYQPRYDLEGGIRAYVEYLRGEIASREKLLEHKTAAQAPLPAGETQR